MTFRRERLPDTLTYFESQGLTLSRAGKWRSAPCPFHGGSDSLRINADSGGWICMSCAEKGGDVLAFHMALHGMEFVEAAKALGAWDDDPRGSHMPPTKPLPFSPRKCLEVLREEALLAAVAAGNIARGVELTEVDRKRLQQAAATIDAIAEAVST